jgi:hypothetical protein
MAHNIHITDIQLHPHIKSEASDYVNAGCTYLQQHILLYYTSKPKCAISDDLTTYICYMHISGDLPDDDGLWWREPEEELDEDAKFAWTWSNWFGDIKLQELTGPGICTYIHVYTVHMQCAQI